MKKFTWKRWLIVVATIILFLFGVVGGINYAVDPFWCFNHGAFIGKFQPMFDERQQKTNWLTFHDVDIDTVILGNSRVTYLDTRDVPGKAFNYAASSMRPSEFPDYLAYAAKRSESEITTVILGVSFVGGTSGSVNADFDSPQAYINRANSLGFRFRNLLNLRLLKYSIQCVKRERENDFNNCYVRQGNVVLSRQMMLPIPKKSLEKVLGEQISLYAASAYGKNYRYVSNIHLYEEMQKAFPDVRFVVFITPVTHNLLSLLVQQGLLEDYKKWVADLVSHFEEVWNFMYPNAVTGNNDYFKDAHHYSPEVARWIAQKIMGMPYQGPQDFGVKVNKQNLAEHLDFLNTMYP